MGELTNLQDPEEELNGVGCDAQGILRLRPGTHTATIPQTPEQLRMRHKVSAHAWIFAGFKATACKWLKGFNIKVYTDLSDYILGEHIMGLKYRNASNQVVGRPPLGLGDQRCHAGGEARFQIYLRGGRPLWQP